MTDNRKTIEIKPLDMMEADLLNIREKSKANLISNDISQGAANPENVPGGHIEIDNFLKNLKTTPIVFHGPTNDRQRAVVNAFKHSWRGYKQFAWGADNLKPISTQPHDWFGLGLSIIDSLDTMFIMNLKEGIKSIA